MNSTPTLASLGESYPVAHQGAIVVDRSELGLLKFSGKSRLDLINRMSTNEVLSIQPGQGRATVLTTDIGRIIDRLVLYVDEAAVYALTGPGYADEIARYLMRFVFFNDDFHIEDLSAATAILGIYGCGAGSHLAALFGEEIMGLPLHHWRAGTMAEMSATIHRADPLAGDGFLLMCQVDAKSQWWAALSGAGVLPAESATFDYLRIESGVPLLGRELTQDYIPLEANLWDDVSFGKGCYIGQEIIARMESRGRIAKKLHRLRLSGNVPAGTELSPTEGGRSAGVLTSVADGPDGVLALGYVRTNAFDATNELQAAGTSVQLLD